MSARASLTAKADKITPRASLDRFSPENIERLLRIIESGPSQEEWSEVLNVSDQKTGREHVRKIHTKAARVLCENFYAKKYPDVPLSEIKELKGVTLMINALDTVSSREYVRLTKVVVRVGLVNDARAELEAIKRDFNALGL